MEIEEVAAKTPEKILREPIDVDCGLFAYQARNMAFRLGLEGAQVRSAESFLRKLCRFFLDSDCSLVEVNPLVITKAGEMIALDSKVSFDDNALFRHESFEALRDTTEENAMEIRAGEAGLSFVKLEGNIGCLVNGAGLAMSTMDLIKLHGGEPANFLDVGGGANVDQVTEAFRILLSDKNVRGVLVNIFGGIMKCDTIVEALLSAYEKVGFNVPLVVRLEGTNVEKARDMLAASGRNIIAASDLTDAARKVVAAIGA
jgi:succinyl-CoA synthetase beta subunit